MALSSLTQSFRDRLSQLEARQLASGAKDRFLSIMERRDQLLAVLVLPFFLVASMGFAKVVHEIILEFLPDAVGSIGAVVFLSGAALVVATLGASFAWVKTGGFGLFES